MGQKKYLILIFTLTLICFPLGLTSSFGVSKGNPSILLIKNPQAKINPSVFPLKSKKNHTPKSNKKLNKSKRKLVKTTVKYIENHQSIPNGKVQNKLKWFGEYYLKKIESQEVCGGSMLRSSKYQGPSSATLIVSEAVASCWRTNFTLAPQILTLGLGFDVTKTITVTDNYHVDVPSDKTYKVEIYPYYMVYTFDIWYHPVFGSDYKTGSGIAKKPIGLCFKYYSL